MLLESLKMEYSKSNIENIFFEYIIKNTKNGSIEIPIYNENIKEVERRTFNITLTINDPSNEFNLYIKDKNKFIDLLYEYVGILIAKGSIKNNNDIIYYLTLIWCNCTYEDLNNPEVFIQKYIAFENNQLFENHVFAHAIPELLDSDILITITKQNPNYETPYLFKLTIKNGNFEYYLPSISYGIYNNCCYIYTIQNKNLFSNDINYEKKIKRLLYKLNDKVRTIESSEYLSYQNGDDYYPENISDVSPSVILSLSCFLKLLYEKKIQKVKVVPYLPLRYKNKEDYYQKLYAYKEKFGDSKKELVDEYEKEHLKIQQNLTEKFIRNFRRIHFHFPNIKITSFPMDLDECMHLYISEFGIADNILLSSIMDSHEIIDKNLKR